MRRAAKVDANHAVIRDALRAAGCSVADTSGVGDGFPDLVVGYVGRAPFHGCADYDGRRNLLIEVKDGDKSPSRRKLTPDQEQFAQQWRGQWACVSSVAEALALVGIVA